MIHIPYEKATVNEEIGRQIKRAREAANLTQEKLSEILDCSPQYISMLENGRYGISTKMLRTLCKALNISSDSILFPGSNKRNMDIVCYRCRDLSDEQFRLLIDIINRYIDAVSLPPPDRNTRE